MPRIRGIFASYKMTLFEGRRQGLVAIRCYFAIRPAVGASAGPADERMAQLHRIIEPYEFTLGIGKRALGAGTSRVVVTAADVLRTVANLPELWLRDRDGSSADFLECDADRASSTCCNRAGSALPGTRPSPGFKRVTKAGLGGQAGVGTQGDFLGALTRAIETLSCRAATNTAAIGCSHAEFPGANSLEAGRDRHISGHGHVAIVTLSGTRTRPATPSHALLGLIIKWNDSALGIAEATLGAIAGWGVITAADVLRIIANLPAGTGRQNDSQFKIFRLRAGGRHKNTDTDKQ